MKKFSRKMLTGILFCVTLVLACSLLANKYFENEMNNKIKLTEALDVTELKDILNKHKGSLLYVYHSSINCSPCFVEMRDHVPALQKRFAGKPITFVYICSESNFPLKKITNGVLWRKKLAKLDISGSHYLISKVLSLDIFRETVEAGAGEIAFYPWQFIVDEKGNIINKHAERPSDSLQLYKQLDSLLLTRK